MDNTDLKMMIALQEHDLTIKRGMEEDRIRRELAARPLPAATADGSLILCWLREFAASVRQRPWPISVTSRREVASRVAACDAW